MATIRRFDRYTELGPYIAWIHKLDEGEYTIAVQVGNHRIENDEDDTFETEDQALEAADGLAHQLQK
ncbi:MAG TPA: hypothetical protein VFR91_00715 [Dyella sp.]|nr:hypothetical protein [Dyella sp.]